jgi:ADP-heptose:LPS heptosyltransferase
VIATAGLALLIPALAALARIRGHHRDARISLICAPEVIDFAKTSPYVDDAWSESLPPWWQGRERREMGERLRAKGFTVAYDLEDSPLSRAVRAMVPEAQWSTLAAAPPVHIRDRLATQIQSAGLGELLPHDLTWVAGRVTGFDLPLKMTDPFVLIATDPAPSDATWPQGHTIALAEQLVAQDLIPVLVGLAPASALAQDLKDAVPRAVDLTGRANLNDLVFLGWAARGAVGADNGLMHLFAAAGCRAVVLYDNTSDPARTGQRGTDVLILRRARLSDIPVGEVVAALKQRR